MSNVKSTVKIKLKLHETNDLPSQLIPEPDDAKNTSQHTIRMETLQKTDSTVQNVGMKSDQLNMNSKPTVNKHIDEYHCIKLPIKKILHPIPQTHNVMLNIKNKNDELVAKEIRVGNTDREELLMIINDAVLRTHKIIIKTYLLLRYWVLFQYQIHQSIPQINEDLIECVMKTVCLPSSDFGKIRKPDKLSLMKELKDLNPFENENDQHLSGILNYQVTNIITAVENNITMRFSTHLRRLLTLQYEKLFPELLKTHETRKQFHKDMGKVKDDLLSNRPVQEYTSDQRYHVWVSENKPNILPSLDSQSTYYYDLHVDPQKYLKYLLYINIEIEKLGGAPYQFFPLRTDVIPKHIQIDTKTLIELLISIGTADMLDAIQTCQSVLWETFFKIKPMNNEYSFDHTIITDGFSVAIRYIHRTALEKKLKKIQKMKNGRTCQRQALAEGREFKKKEKPISVPRQSKPVKKTPEFLYIDEVSPEDLEGWHLYLDPGTKSLLTGVSDEPDDPYFQYTSRQRLNITKRIKYQRLVRNQRDKQGIPEIEQLLSGYNSKTCDLVMFRLYMIKKIMVNQQLYDKYLLPKYRQYKWYGYLNRMRADHQLVKDFTTFVTQKRQPHRKNKTRKKQKIKRRTRQQLASQEVDHLIRDMGLPFNKKHEKKMRQREFHLKRNIKFLKQSLELTNPRQKLVLKTHKTTPYQTNEFEQSIRSMDQTIDELDQKIMTLTHELKSLRQQYWKDRKQYIQLRMEQIHNIVPRSVPVVARTVQDQKSTPSPILIMGDWSKGKEMRGKMSTPNIRILRLLAKHFKVFLIDEFRTSKLEYRSEQVCDNLYLLDEKNKMRKIHSVLTYKTENQRLGCINRDNNACHNMRKLFRYFLETGGRPQRYQRGFKL